MHCVPVWKDMCAGQESPCNWEHLIANQDLPPTKLKQMVGKGWHIQAIGSFVMFMLSAIECREEVFLQHPIEWFFEPEDPWDIDDATVSGGAETDEEASSSSPWSH